MSKELDELLAKMNECLGDRKHDDVPLNDDYWKHRENYMQALHNADGVHVPVVEDEVLDTSSSGPSFDKTEEEHKKEIERKTALEQLKSIGIH